MDVNQHKRLPLSDFIEVLAENFTRYQRYVDGEYQIVPREKQKRFLEHIICGGECFHFSEVGSGKTKGEQFYFISLVKLSISQPHAYLPCLNVNSDHAASLSDFLIQ